MRELALFAGAGGGILGGILLGWRTICAVELDPYCRSVLLARQRDRLLPRFPIWDDVRTFDGRPWKGSVDVISGGFPCQDISCAGKRGGLAGKHSGLWSEFARIISEVRPTYVFVENSQHLRTRGLVTVLQNLAGLGYDAKWGVIGAKEVGAPHIRRRMWIVSYVNSDHSRKRKFHFHAEVERPPKHEEFHSGVADSNGKQIWKPTQKESWGRIDNPTQPRFTDWWPVDVIAGMDDGVAHRMDRVKATGNGQVPRVAALAWETLRR